jgi:hypothetical protein
MVRGYLRVLLTAAAVTFAGMPVRGQTVVPQPAAVAIAPAPAIDPAITTYYALRPGAQIWFRDADTRTAAMKLPALFKRAASDSLSDGAALAAQV